MKKTGKRGTRGLSMIEILLVLIIVSISAAGAVPFLGKGVENSKMKPVKSSVRALRNAVLFYADDHNGTLPASMLADPHDLSKLLNANYIMPGDLAFHKEGDATGKVANYSVTPVASGGVIRPVPADQKLFKVCGKFDAASTREFCIYQCANGGRESTEETKYDTCRDKCPESC